MTWVFVLIAYPNVISVCANAFWPVSVSEHWFLMAQCLKASVLFGYRLQWKLMSGTVSGSFSEMRECMCTDIFTYIIEKDNVKLFSTWSPHGSMFWQRTTHRSIYSYLFLRQCGKNKTPIMLPLSQTGAKISAIYLFEGYSEYLSKSKKYWLLYRHTLKSRM